MYGSFCNLKPGRSRSWSHSTDFLCWCCSRLGGCSDPLLCRNCFSLFGQILIIRCDVMFPAGCSWSTTCPTKTWRSVTEDQWVLHSTAQSHTHPHTHTIQYPDLPALFCCQMMSINLIMSQGLWKGEFYCTKWESTQRGVVGGVFKLQLFHFLSS